LFFGLISMLLFSPVVMNQVPRRLETRKMKQSAIYNLPFQPSLYFWSDRSLRMYFTKGKSRNACDNADIFFKQHRLFLDCDS
jgi:hypothetical protein